MYSLKKEDSKEYSHSHFRQAVLHRFRKRPARAVEISRLVYGGTPHEKRFSLLRSPSRWKGKNWILRISKHQIVRIRRTNEQRLRWKCTVTKLNYTDMCWLMTLRLEESLKEYSLYSQYWRGREVVCVTIFTLGSVHWFIFVDYCQIQRFHHPSDL